MTKHTKILAYSLLCTGMVIYANSFLRAIESANAGLVFFGTQDLFADYIKLVASYPGQAAVKIDAWLPANWSQIIRGYLATNPYGSNPLLVHQGLAHFGLPPLAQIFYVFSRQLIGRIGAATGLIGSLLIGVLWLMWCTKQAINTRQDRLLFASFSMLVFPSLLLLTRGNVSSLYSSLAVCSAFLLALQPFRASVLPIILLSLATGLRPNNIVYLPLLSIVSAQARPRAGRLRLLILYGAVMAASLALFFSVLHWMYPSFTLDRFIASYKWIAQNYDTSSGNVLFVSSPLQIANAFLVKVLGPIRAQWILPFVRVGLLLSGLGICLCSFLLRLRERLSIPASILLCTAGMIIASPWFVDYHLLILITPLLCSAAIEQGSPVSVKASAETGKGGLSSVDSVLIVAMLIPKPFSFSSLPNSGALINPLILASYSLFVIWRHRTRIFATRFVTHA